jgi:hypothetical protein
MAGEVLTLRRSKNEPHRNFETTVGVNFGSRQREIIAGLCGDLMQGTSAQFPRVPSNQVAVTATHFRVVAFADGRQEQFLGQGLVPELLQRPNPPLTAENKRELPLSNPMR